MKKTIIILMVVFFPLMGYTAGIKSTDVIPPKIERSLSPEEVNVLLLRVNEINALDKSNLTSIEKRKLRSEVKAIKSKVNNGGGIYVSVGAAIIILLLVLILL